MYVVVDIVDERTNTQGCRVGFHNPDYDFIDAPRIDSIAKYKLDAREVSLQDVLYSSEDAIRYCNYLNGGNGAKFK